MTSARLNSRLAAGPMAGKSLWRLVAALLALCIAMQGLATATQRTLSRAHFHIKQAEPTLVGPSPMLVTTRVIQALSRAPRAQSGTHHHHHGHEHAEEGGIEAARPHRLFIHTYELEEDMASPPAAQTAAMHQDPAHGHAVLEQHEHVPDATGVVYVDDATSASSLIPAASLSRDLNDLDSLLPGLNLWVDPSLGHAWPHDARQARACHISAVPLRPPSS